MHANPRGFPVHEEGLEPTHLAVPEPKSGERVARGSEGGANALVLRAVRYRSRRFVVAVDDWETIRGPRSAPARQSLLVRGGTHAYAHNMKPAGIRQNHQDSRGRTWSVVVVPVAQAENADADFWRTLTPEQRVVAVHGCLESALKAQGKTRVPRLRRVARVVKR